MQIEITEQWKILTYRNKEIPPLWEISNFGQIRHKEKQNILKTTINQKGYERFNCSVSSKIQYHGFVHVTVAEAFIYKPNPILKLQVNHINGNKQDNYVENLEWVTQSENMKHAIRNGLKIPPDSELSAQKMRKLSAEDVWFVRNNFDRNNKEFNVRTLALFFKVTEPTIRRIINFQSYKNF